MTAVTISRLVDELAREYPGAASASEGQVTFVRLPEVSYPLGCNPASSAALVVLDPQQPAPKLLLRQAPALKDGRTPKNVSAESAAGEGWYTFSFSQPWNENDHTALQFVEGRLRRFDLNE
jgi:hypothetical protein